MGSLVVTGQAAGTGSSGYTVTGTPATFHGGLFTASRITGPVDRVDFRTGWAAFRYRIGDNTISNRYLFYLKSATSSIALYLGNDRILVDHTAGVFFDEIQYIAPTGTPVGTINTTVCAWTPTQVSLSADGGTFTSIPRTAIPAGPQVSLELGCADSANFLNGDILWAAFGNTTLAQYNVQQIAQIPDTMTSDRWPFVAEIIWPGISATYDTAPAVTPTLGGRWSKYSY